MMQGIRRCVLRSGWAWVLGVAPSLVWGQAVTTPTLPPRQGGVPATRPAPRRPNANVPAAAPLPRGGGIDQPQANQPANTLPAPTGPANVPNGPAAPAAGRPPLPANGLLPAPFQLNPEEQTRVDQILNNWAKRNDKIDKFHCEFTRSTFDPVWGPAEPHIPKTISEGKIRYVAPDRGMMQIDGKDTREFAGIDPESKEPQYAPSKESLGEKWICDGESVYQFDAPQKILRQMKLPEEMRGKAIAEGPLPFLFGASADKLKARYYIRELPKPAKVEREYWLEVYPRRVTDAADFRAVRIAMDDRYLPKRMEVIGQPNANKQFLRELYEFRNISINSTLDDLKELAGKLIDTRTPPGWQRIVEDYGNLDLREAPPQQATQPPDRPAAPRIGTRPPNPTSDTAPRRR